MKLNHVAVKTRIDRAGDAAEDVVAPNTGIAEIDGPLGMSGVNGRLEIGGVNPLSGDAVSEEDHAIVVVEREWCFLRYATDRDESKRDQKIASPADGRAS